MTRNIIFTMTILIWATSCSIKNNKSDAYGNFEATEIMVSAQGNGELYQLDLEEGDCLAAGKIVGMIDTTDLNLNKRLLSQQKVTIASQLISIDAEMAVVKQQLDNALITKKRTDNLMKSGAATQKQLDDINGLVELFQKQIEAIQAKKKSIRDQMLGIDVQIEQINEGIDKCLIKNPVDGTVLIKYAEKGELAVMGKPLYKLADLKRMKLKAYISGDQLPQLKIGQQVEVLFDKGVQENQSVKGSVSWISSTAEFTPKTIQTKEERVSLVYAIKVAVDNDGSIKIGMPGECKFNLK